MRPRKIKMLILHHLDKGEVDFFLVWCINYCFGEMVILLQ